MKYSVRTTYREARKILDMITGKKVITTNIRTPNPIATSDKQTPMNIPISHPPTRSKTTPGISEMCSRISSRRATMTTSPTQARTSVEKARLLKPRHRSKTLESGNQQSNNSSRDSSIDKSRNTITTERREALRR